MSAMSFRPAGSNLLVMANTFKSRSQLTSVILTKEESLVVRSGAQQVRTAPTTSRCGGRSFLRQDDLGRCLQDLSISPGESRHGGLRLHVGWMAVRNRRFSTRVGKTPVLAPDCWLL
jgi:hypothetical protein